MIFLILLSSGEIPPCMQRIFSSIRAATGMVLKQSIKIFHIFNEYFLLPTNILCVTFIVKTIEFVDLSGFVVPS